MTTILWILYPIAWGVCEGGNIISPDSEAVFYGILDLLAKPVFGVLLLFGHRNIAPSRLGLSIPDYEGDNTYTGGVRNEKRGHHGNGVGTGVNNGTHTGVTGDGVTGNGAGPTVGVGHQSGATGTMSTAV